MPMVWLAGGQPTMVVDITKRFNKKFNALSKHDSQVGGRKGVKKMVRAWARATAKGADLGKRRLAEGFKVVITN